MAEIKVPIQVNLPDDWIERIVDRLRNDPESEWVEVTRCRDCKYWREHKYAKETKRYIPFCGFNAIYTKADDFCSRAERRKECHEIQYVCDNYRYFCQNCNADMREGDHDETD